MEWQVSVPVSGPVVTVFGAQGTVCLERFSRAAECFGAQGNGLPAGVASLSPEQPRGALIWKTAGGATYFSVNDRAGAASENHAGYFEFDVTVHSETGNVR